MSKSNQNRSLIGRKLESRIVDLAVAARRNLLIEGPVGVGKTYLVQQILESRKINSVRIDGDSRYSEQKLTGWFDPAIVIKKGYIKEAFVPGPLVEAMQSGSVLFINELNRMPESVQNILLPAIDEGMIHIPQWGELRAKEGFFVIATQNPKEFVGTSTLGEALSDRFEWIYLDYQSEAEEILIVDSALGGVRSDDDLEDMVSWVVRIVRLTRSHPKIKRGASVRAAIAMAKLLLELSKNKRLGDDDFLLAAMMSLPTRMEWVADEFNGSQKRQQYEEVFLKLIEEVKKKVS